MRKPRIAVAAAALLAATCAIGQADDFPNRTVQLMVAYPPGGSTDVGARVVASIAEKILGKPMVVVNKAGAGGQVGWTDMARQKPDGYYIGYLNLPATNTVVLDPGLVWVRGDSPYKTLKDLVDAAKKAPNTIRTATTGILSDDHLAILMLEEAAPGAVFRIVHLEGGAAQLKEIMGGHVDVAFDNVGSVAPRVRSGELRGLAVMDPQRSKFVPDVPTTKEAGYPSVISNSTRGIAAPRGTPQPVLKKLEAALRKAMEDPEHVQKMEAAGLAVKIMVGEEYARYYRETHAQAKKYTEWAKNRPHK